MLCTACGVEILYQELALCRHHAMAADVRWATQNKIMCDYFHRGVAPEENPAWIEAIDPAPLPYDVIMARAIAEFGY